MRNEAIVVGGVETRGLAELRRGWSVLLGAVIGVGIGVSSLPYYTFGVFLKDIETEFGWSRAELALGQLVYLASLAVASPLVGSLIDRYGVRRPLAAAMVGLTAAFVLLGTVMDSMAAFLGIYAGLAIVGSASSPIAYTRVVNAWFVRIRGLALGLTLTGTGLAAAATPVMLAWVIGQYGWRAGYVALAAVVVLLMPVVLVLLRATPTSSGPVSSVRASSGKHAAPAAADAALRPVLRSRTFWQLAFAFTIVAIGVNGLVTHFIPMLTDQGIGLGAAAATAGLIGVAVIAGRLMIGAMVDRLFAPYVAGVALAASALGYVAMAVGGAAFAPLAACAIGFALGAEADLLAYLTSRYFGLAVYGRVYGLLYAAFMLGTGLSPLWIGIVFDRLGNYTPALLISGAFVAVAVVLFFLLPRFPASDYRVAQRAHS